MTTIVELDKATRRVRELEGDLAESRNGRLLDVHALTHQRDGAHNRALHLEAELDRVKGERNEAWEQLRVERVSRKALDRTLATLAGA